jgi:hypothetical protein
MKRAGVRSICDLSPGSDTAPVRAGHLTFVGTDERTVGLRRLASLAGALV